MSAGTVTPNDSYTDAVLRPALAESANIPNRSQNSFVRTAWPHVRPGVAAARLPAAPAGAGLRRMSDAPASVSSA